MTLKLHPISASSDDPLDLFEEQLDGEVVRHINLRARDDGRELTVQIPLSDLARWLKTPSLGFDLDRLRSLLVSQPAVLASIEDRARRLSYPGRLLIILTERQLTASRPTMTLPDALPRARREMVVPAAA